MCVYEWVVHSGQRCLFVYFDSLIAVRILNQSKQKNAPLSRWKAESRNDTHNFSLTSHWQYNTIYKSDTEH